MRHWEVVLIPLIAFGAWILSTIFKATEQAERRRQDERRPRRPQQPQSRPRQAPSWMPPPRPTRPAPVIATVIEEAPRLVVPRPAPVAPRPAPVAPRPAPVEPPPFAPPIPDLQLAPRKPVSPVLKEVVRLLRSPRTAAAALVMREILDRPVGLRRK